MSDKLLFVKTRQLDDKIKDYEELIKAQQLKGSQDEKKDSIMSSDSSVDER
jgi:hypothetical protein